MRGVGSVMLGFLLLLGAAPIQAQSIFDAVKTGTPAQVQALAAKDASLVNAKDASGKTPLHHAAIVGSVPMIECLLSLGAAIDAPTTENLTPLLEAIRSGQGRRRERLDREGGEDRRRAALGGEAQSHGRHREVDRQGGRHRRARPAGIHAADVGRADGRRAVRGDRTARQEGCECQPPGFARQHAARQRDHLRQRRQPDHRPAARTICRGEHGAGRAGVDPVGRGATGARPARSTTTWGRAAKRSSHPNPIAGPSSGARRWAAPSRW